MREKFIKTISDILYPIVKLYWFVFRPKIHGVKCIVEKNGQILLVRHTYGRRLWGFPGGSVKKDEDLYDAVKREVKEEVGIELENVKQIGSFVDTSQYVQDHIYCFVANPLSERLNINENEILEARWVSLVNLPSVGFIAQKILDLWQQEKL